MMNFTKTLERNAERRPTKLVVTCGERQLSNAELLRRVHALALAMRDEGLGPGDVVALLLENCTEFMETIFAINAIGGVFLPLNYRLAQDEWRYILEHAGARLIVTEPEYHDAARALVAELPDLNACWTIGAGPGDASSDYEARVASHLDYPSPPVIDAGLDDVQRLMYTSGTTSRPKGVPITHGNLLWKNIAHIIELGLQAEDKTLIAGPLYHVGGLDLPATGVLYVGGSVAVLRQFDPVAVLESIERERVTNVWLPPAMINRVLAESDVHRYDLSSVRLVISGGEKMPESLVADIVGLFRSAWFADAYGLTETVSGDTFLDAEHVLSKLGSVGRSVPHLDLRVVGDDGDDVATGETGEVVLRGPKVFAGYWRDPRATAEALRGGWFHTGDMGRVDEEGYLYIDDRKKDMIISGGENIASLEVERVLYEHPAVLEAAVVGIPDVHWGEAPMAIVVLHPNKSVSAGELVSFCAAKLAKFKVPKRIEFVENLPRTPSGKVLKRTLRAELAASTRGEDADGAVGER